MNTHAALVMIAVMAAFGLATAMLALPIVPQAHAVGSHLSQNCHKEFSGSDIGGCARTGDGG
jgi:hypothetical protein